MTASQRKAVTLFLVGLVPILTIPAFTGGLLVGTLLLIVPLAAAVIMALRPKR
jgi:hypothetical protein